MGSTALLPQLICIRRPNPIGHRYGVPRSTRPPLPKLEIPKKSRKSSQICYALDEDGTEQQQLQQQQQIGGVGAALEEKPGNKLIAHYFSFFLFQFSAQFFLILTFGPLLYILIGRIMFMRAIFFSF